MLKVKCSGAYRNGGDLVDFTDLELTMPDCPQDWIQFNAMNRCFVMQAEKKFSKRIDSIHSLYIDKVEELKTKVKEEVMGADGKKKIIEKEVAVLPSCCGKKIKSLIWQELQDLAMMFCLREVPLFRDCDLRTAQAKAYRAYVNYINGGDLDEAFDFAAAPDFDVPNVATKIAKYKTNSEEVLTGKDAIGEYEEDK